MPDLIIKPTTTSGNKLILQDQAGGAVLTTADSGATVANATLTTPTIASMANCTFPAGHILSAGSATVAQMSNQTGTWEASMVLGTTSGTSALTSSSNKVWIHANCRVQNRNDDQANDVNVYLSGGGLGATTSGKHFGSLGWESAQYESECASVAVIDASPGATTPTYKIYCSATGSTWHFAQIYFTYMEIKA